MKLVSYGADIETMMSKLGVESSHEDDHDDHDDHSHKRRRRRRQTQQADHVKPAVDSTVCTLYVIIIIIIIMVVYYELSKRNWTIKGKMEIKLELVHVFIQ